ncbi:relaxase/mobilization nuclease domain-containing protein [Aeromonas salmonicida]|uniref:relaxase/mobilization nuclease domain-containing protein n=1 Tax=Aeromonas salmonicida TaxID=645 RepID=UPI003D034CAE
MKGKITTGSTPAPLIRYISCSDRSSLASGKKSSFIGGNISSQVPAEQADEFQMVGGSRRAKNFMAHISLSLPPSEINDDKKWEGIAYSLLNKMGLNPDVRPWVAYKHEEPNQHIHIAVSKYDYNGNLWKDSFSALRLIQATSEIEVEFKLTLTKGLSRGIKRTEKTNLKSSEIQMADRLKKVPNRLILQHAIDQVLSTGLEISSLAFCEQLEILGINARASLSSTGKLNGFSFEVNGVPFKGSDLGKKYTLSGIEKRGFRYEKTREFEELSCRAYYNDGNKNLIDNTSTGRNASADAGYAVNSDSIGSAGVRDIQDDARIRSGCDTSTPRLTNRAGEANPSDDRTTQDDRIRDSNAPCRPSSTNWTGVDDADKSITRSDTYSRSSVNKIKDDDGKDTKISQSNSSKNSGSAEILLERHSRLYSDSMCRTHLSLVKPLGVDPVLLKLINAVLKILNIIFGHWETISPYGIKTVHEKMNVKEMICSIPDIVNLNRKGYEVNLVPDECAVLREQYSYIIIDNVGRENLNVFLGDTTDKKMVCFKPCIVVEKNVGLYQVVLKTKLERREFINAVAKDLNHKYGEVKSNEDMYAIKLAGFQNGDFTVNHIHMDENTECTLTRALVVEKIREYDCENHTFMGESPKIMVGHIALDKYNREKSSAYKIERENSSSLKYKASDDTLSIN